MGSDRKRPAARDSATSIQPRFVGVEPLESRLFCDHGLATAIGSATYRSADRATMVTSGGSTLATAQNLGALTQIAAFRGTLTSSVHNEYFKFSVSGSCTVGLSLTGLSGNADLQLIKAAPGNQQVTASTPIATSAHPGTVNESIGRKIPAGVYYVRVYEAGGTAGFTLTLSTSVAKPNSNPPPVTTGRLHIVFNYGYDSSGFFALHPQAKTLMNQAAGVFSRFTNVLNAITPGNGNSWTENFTDPSNVNRQITISNPSVASDTLVIYVGATNGLQTSELGFGAPGGWSAMGSQSWITAVTSRGQAGAMKDKPTGFGPWGGVISFSDTTNWNLSTGLPAANQNDFLSVATHEISHVLGFGTSDSWHTFVSGNTFVGPHSEAANGGKAVPLASGLAHWSNNFASTVNGVRQDALMDPYLITGTRRAFTLLDYAGLEDVGWTI